MLSNLLTEELKEELATLVEHNRSILGYCRDLHEVEQSTSNLKAVMDRFVYAWSTASSLVQGPVVRPRARPAKFDKDWIPTGRRIDPHQVIERCKKTTRM